MFVVGTSPSSTHSGVPQVVLSEDSTTLDCLLRFFDPEKDPLPYNSETISCLLEAARKYHVPRVMKWWEKELQIDLVAAQEAKLQDPMLCLVLADRYGMKNVARVALRELIKAPAETLHVEFALESRILVLLDKLRHERVARLTQMVDKLVSQATKMFVKETLLNMWKTSTTNVDGVNLSPSKSRKSTDNTIIPHVHASKAQVKPMTSLELQMVLSNLVSWTINLTVKISKEPKWEVVSRAFDVCEPIEWRRFVETVALKESETQAAKLENELPELPTWLGDI